jgi:two-component system, OmpR family, sensor histidine kinase MprB
MSLRRRLALAVGAAAGVAITLAALIAYVAVRAELRGQVDERLTEDAALVTALPAELPAPAPGVAPFELPSFAGVDAGRPDVLRVTTADGDVLAQRTAVPLPAPSEASGARELTDAESGGEHLRVLTAPVGADGTVVQIARSLEGVDDALANLRAVLFLAVMAGIAVSALAARWIAGRLLAPVASLTGAAEHVSETDDLSRRIEVAGDDEVARLGRRFNGMLERLERSREELAESHAEQRRLIADASHELRTPVTSLRTNIELIASGRLSEADARGALESAVAQTEELSDVVGDLMDLARGEAPQPEVEPVRLDDVVRQALARARRHAPGVDFTLVAEPAVVEGAPDRLARAVNNLLDNAAQHADGAGVEVTVAPGLVTVRDHGPGVDPDESARIFDRFYRGADARGRPGSGLGLAIVRQVAEAHGGRVSVANADGGGAVFELRLPDGG